MAHRRLGRRGGEGVTVRIGRHALAMAARARAFLGDTRAGATAIAAAAVTVMTVGASALIVDHVWLVDQRDVLKTAADAAAIAATLEIERRLAADPDISDEDLKAALHPVAARYVFMNLLYLPEERLERAARTLEVAITDLDRDQRTVAVSAQADLGGTLFSRALPLLGSYEGPEKTVVRAGVEIESTPVEVVLAIDVSYSMSFALGGEVRRRNFWNPGAALSESRLDIVKRAARSLVDILEPDARNRVAVGVVPWHANVRLGPAAADEWARNGWARYPRRRTYPIPWWCSVSKGLLTGEIDDCVISPVVDDLPASPPAGWLGCLDSHRLGAGGAGPSRLPDRTAEALFATPAGSPFAQSYFPPRGDSHTGTHYRCRDASEMPESPSFICYETRQDFAQHLCAADDPVLHALSTDPDAIKSTIDALVPTNLLANGTGSLTHSSYGVLWAQRMLEPAWKGVWGGAVHPADPATPGHAGLRKAIVLLTDGEDSPHCGPGGDSDCSRTALVVPRAEACALAKARGTEIFIVAAMKPGHIGSDFESDLRACSSEADHPDGDYVFLNNTTPEDLEAAFADIGEQLRTVRRVY